MIIITGIGRCGTSLLAGYCKNIGLNIGNVDWKKQYKAGNEDQTTTRINHHIFKRGCDSDTLELIKSLKRDVVKDPMFMRSTEIIGGWIQARSDIEVVWCRRPYQAIIRSQRRRPDMLCPAYRCFEDLMEEKENEFRKFLEENNVKYTDIWYKFDYKDVQRIFGGTEEIYKNTLI